MLKRVNSTRIRLCTVLVLLVLVTLCTAVPVSAREYVSVGQAGDPGDGSEIAESGGSVAHVPSGNSSTTDSSTEWTWMLVPLWVNGALIFQIVVLSARRIAGQ